MAAKCSGASPSLHVLIPPPSPADPSIWYRCVQKKNNITTFDSPPVSPDHSTWYGETIRGYSQRGHKGVHDGNASLGLSQGYSHERLFILNGNFKKWRTWYSALNIQHTIYIHATASIHRCHSWGFLFCAFSATHNQQLKHAVAALGYIAVRLPKTTFPMIKCSEGRPNMIVRTQWTSSWFNGVPRTFGMEVLLNVLLWFRRSHCYNLLSSFLEGLECHGLPVEFHAGEM